MNGVHAKDMPSSCAQKLRTRIDHFLPPQLQEAVVVPEDLQCERKMIIVNGPSGVGKTEYIRAKYPRYVSASTDHLQYTGPCRQRLFETRARGADEDVFKTCEDLGQVVSDVVLRESFKTGANVAFELNAGIDRAPSYERALVLVFRPFEEAYANVMTRHHDVNKTSVPWAANDFSDMHDYVSSNYVLHMQKATNEFVQANIPVSVVNTSGNRARPSTLKAALKELTRAMLFLHGGGAESTQLRRGAKKRGGSRKP